MIEQAKYIEVVNDYYSFLETELGFGRRELIAYGNAYYDVRFENKELKMIVSISYENIADYLQVNVYLVEDGQMPDYDDYSRILGNKERSRAIEEQTTPEDFRQNAIHFEGLKAETELERSLLKSAKDLRLYLKYLA